MRAHRGIVSYEYAKSIVCINTSSHAPRAPRGGGKRRRNGATPRVCGLVNSRFSQPAPQSPRRARTMMTSSREIEMQAAAPATAGYVALASFPETDPASRHSPVRPARARRLERCLLGNDARDRLVDAPLRRIFVGSPFRLTASPLPSASRDRAGWPEIRFPPRSPRRRPPRAWT